jgi:hypothetical protein
MGANKRTEPSAARFIFCAKGHNIGRRYSRAWIGRSVAGKRGPVSTFSKHVRDICLRRPCEKMLGTDAQWVITMMADIHLGGDWATTHDPDEPMRCYQSAVPVEQAIAAAGSVAFPNPAVVGLFNVRPEPGEIFFLSGSAPRHSERLL